MPPLLEFRRQLVKQVRVHADSGGDGEVASGGLAVEILVLNSAERDAADFAVDSDFGGGAGAERDCADRGRERWRCRMAEWRARRACQLILE